MKQYYVVRTQRGKLKLQETAGNHEYTIKASTYRGAEECLRMIQMAEKRLRNEDQHNDDAETTI